MNNYVYVLLQEDESPAFISHPQLLIPVSLDKGFAPLITEH